MNALQMKLNSMEMSQPKKVSQVDQQYHQHILKAAEDGDIKAVLLLDQIKTFRKDKPYWFESTIRFNYGTLIPTTEN